MRAKSRKYCPVCGESWSTNATTAVCNGVAVTLSPVPPVKETR